MNHHQHSHAADISATERERIQAFLQTQTTRDEAWRKFAEQILGELAFYTEQAHTQTGLWTMGELDRFVSDYLPSHTGSAQMAQAAPQLVTLFSQWLKESATVPACDVAAIEKRMRKISKR